MLALRLRRLVLPLYYNVLRNAKNLCRSSVRGFSLLMHYEQSRNKFDDEAVLSDLSLLSDIYM